MRLDSETGMTIYSYSRLNSFKQCPLKYKYAYVDGVKQRRRTAPAFMGNRFHEVMEHLYKGIPHRVPSVEELNALFLKLWEAKWSDDIRIVRRDRTAQDYKAIGLRAIEDYFRRYSPFDQGRVLGLERNLHCDLDGSGRYRLRCIIDRLMGTADGVFEIHDYKTSASLPEQARLDQDEQLALYEIAVREAWPNAKGVDLIWHYVAFDMELRSSRTPAQTEELRKKTCAAIDEVESATEFPPRESTLCQWCDFQTICPLHAHRFKVEGMALEEYATDDAIGIVNGFTSLDAERHALGERIKAIEAQQERLKQRAIATASDEGVRRLFGDTHLLTIRDEIKVRYPKKGELARTGFEEALRGLGLWDEVQDISFNTLKSLASRSGWSAEGGVPAGLGEYLEVSPVKQVRLSKRKDIKNDDEIDI